MKKNILLSAVLASTLFITGCSSTNANISQSSEKVQMLIKKNQLEVVDFDYIKQAIGQGTKKSATAIIIDARPELKYKKSSIPTSINIPDTKFDEFYKQLESVSKEKELIVYCGGWNCAKSPKVAEMLKKKGFKDVKLYQAGEPEWIKRNYKEVDTIVVKASQEKNSSFLIDARPYVKYMQETIIGSISIPDTKIEELKGRFPNDKNEKVIVFCGGYSCVKSHNVANKLIELGYKDVSVYAGGLPKWKELGLPTTKNENKVSLNQNEQKTKYSKNGLLLGADEGTVDGVWFTKLLKDNMVPSYVQIVDVTTVSEYNEGHLKGAINIEADKLTAKELYSKLPKNKTIVFNCTAGGRSTEAWTKLNDEKFDMSEIYYFDANIDCKGTSCKIEPNEPIE